MSTIAVIDLISKLISALTNVFVNERYQSMLVLIVPYVRLTLFMYLFGQFSMDKFTTVKLLHFQCTFGLGYQLCTVIFYLLSNVAETLYRN